MMSAQETAPRTFKPRGGEFQRLTTFVDAAFAFALTLLVISFDAVPQSYAELVEALRGVPAFAGSFAIIVMLWVAHHDWTRSYGLDDTPSLLISLLLVFVVMIYVYPLRSMMAAAISQVTGGWAPSSFELENVDQVRGLFTIYGTGFAAATGCVALLYLHALRRRATLQLTDWEAATTRSGAIIWLVVASVGVVSIVLARTLPAHLLGFAGWVYSVLAILTPVLSILFARKARKCSHTEPAG